ncbi:hypothetical protein SAMN05421503_0844 [Terribacillus aidingensis]|uniref:Uncharacterized protein n=1 Tax=Terribacillus aidingensis TaxID=586416 RepID=A0A285N6I6_9BACI|nr:hypothetical protein [Terribacillus aidingensis]SNZ05039.1 hypothetical protein SAMN05421503_0844 [Terribacillus aidingensis]
MYIEKTLYKKAIRFGLLFYSIFAGVSGTITFAAFLLWVVPKEEIQDALLPIATLAIPLYVTCIISLLIRAKFFRKEDI